jgi:hypothetical protein
MYYEVYYKAKGRWAWKGFRTKENRRKWINKNKDKVEIVSTGDIPKCKQGRI